MQNRHAISKLSDLSRPLDLVSSISKNLLNNDWRRPGPEYSSGGCGSERVYPHPRFVDDARDLREAVTSES